MFPPRRNQAGVTIVEVLLSAVLIFIGLGSIFEMNTHSIELLRATHLTAASTQMVQERVESIRAMAWPEISNSSALAILLQTPVASEKEMNAPGLTETITLSVPQPANGQVLPNEPAAPVGEVAPNGQWLQVQRQDGQVRILQSADLGTQPMLLADVLLKWGPPSRVQQRDLRVIICRTGLTRAGIFGSVFGRPVQDPSLISLR
jgi:hypothetical protein